MTETTTTYAAGTFCWGELATTHQINAKRFYSQLFGWQSNDIPIDAQAAYTMLQLRGRDVAALYKLDPTEPGDPRWVPFVAVASADDAAAGTPRLGGTVVAPPFDVYEAGRMAVLQDPTGATFCVWQANQHLGAGAVGQPGAVCWHELATRNVDVAGKFYVDLFGWRAQSQPTPRGTYTTFVSGGRAVGGMVALASEGSAGAPAWLMYFGADDCAAGVARAQSLGALLHAAPESVPGVGRCAVLRDPQGAAFGLVSRELTTRG